MNAHRHAVCLFALTVLIVIPGCPPPRLGGGCAYDETPGVATIISVSAAGPDGYNCPNDPFEVVFDFVPTDPEAADLAQTGRHLTVSAGANPPLAWIEDEGLTEGTQHNVVRRDITKGTCTPLLFRFIDVDYDAGVAACFDTGSPD